MRKQLLLALSTISLLSSCGGGTPTSSGESSSTSSSPVVTYKTISKEEYKNKTLGGLLGQMAGFLSGYEFVWDGPLPRLALPENWFSFCDGPYAGNFTYYEPSGDKDRYNRLKHTGLKGELEIASDDDYHLDIFNQTIIDEYGWSSKAITDAWYDYKVFDWGGGVDAMSLINKNKMLSPYTGTIESGNRFGWCTEAYIENETLGMDAAGLPNVAVNLTDTFASNVGYYDSVVWAKFYAACYSLAYFESDVTKIIDAAKEVLPRGSWPRQMYDIAYNAYNQNKGNRAAAAEIVANARRKLYRLDNIQCDPSVNGGFAILSWLYGGNSYMDCCKWSSLMGYDGDCTAATVTGLLGIIHGFKEGNAEYSTINEKFYHDGEGTYYNDPNYTTHIGTEKYPLHLKIDDIVDLFQKNFEKILVDNGGIIEESAYKIPETSVKADASICFANNDAENRTTENWSTSGDGVLSNIEDTQTKFGHAGSFCFKLVNKSQSAAYHRFNNLKVGSYYRISTYCKTSADAICHIFAKGLSGDETKISFANSQNLFNKKMIFKATSSTMDLGFRFALSSKENDTLYFDDFFVEEIDHDVLFQGTGSLVSANNSITKTLNKPSGYIEGREVVIRIPYAQKTGTSKVIGLDRNGVQYGSVIASNTGYSLNSLSDVLEIPYVFSSANTDYLKLNFESLTMYFGAVEIVYKTNYLFR